MIQIYKLCGKEQTIGYLYLSCEKRYNKRYNEVFDILLKNMSVFYVLNII